MPIPILIDCDPGVDDAVMLLLALASPELEVLAISTVAGNVAVEQTARNARIVREIAGRREVPVHAGCTGPLLRDAVQAGRFHGETGLGPLAICETAEADSDDAIHAVDALVKCIVSHPKQCTLVVTGPMTNVAVALRKAPHIAARIERIVCMGGARSAGGNITASAEFNVFADPHAAQIVLGADIEVVMFGLDVTHQVRTTPERIAAIEALGNPRAQAVADILRFSDGVMREIGIDSGAPLHDPCPIAWLIDPSLFELQPCTIAVETGSALTLGHTAVEFRQPGRHRFATAADADGVFALLTQRLA